jgi:hypothetical protein
VCPGVAGSSVTLGRFISEGYTPGLYTLQYKNTKKKTYKEICLTTSWVINFYENL